MTWNSLEGIDVAFVSGAMPDDCVELRGLVGRERLSQLYEFDLLLWRFEGPFTDDQLDDLLKAPCAIAMGPDEADLVHGILRSIEVIDSPSGTPPRYRATLVPTAWLLSVAKTNRLFQDQSLKTTLKEVLELYKLGDGTHFDVCSDGVTRDHVVQYQESDWDFVQRRLEHDGFFYWFEQHPKNEKLMVADANSATGRIAEPSKVSYRDQNNLSTGGESTVFDWNRKLSRTAARVALLDHNYEQAEPFISGRSPVDADRGFGTVFSFGEHFRDSTEGEALAKLGATFDFITLAAYQLQAGSPDLAPHSAPAR